MQAGVLIIYVFIMVFFAIPFDQTYAQDQSIDEFLEWPSTSNYIFILIALVVLIIIAIIANYLWSNRKGRRFTVE